MNHHKGKLKIHHAYMRKSCLTHFANHYENLPFDHLIPRFRIPPILFSKCQSPKQALKYLNTCFFFYRQSEQNTQQGATGVLWVWSSRKDLCLLANHAIIFISLFFLFRGQFSSFEIENELTLDI